MEPVTSVRISDGSLFERQILPRWPGPEWLRGNCMVDRGKVRSSMVRPSHLWDHSLHVRQRGGEEVRRRQIHFSDGEAGWGTRLFGQRTAVRVSSRFEMYRRGSHEYSPPWWKRASSRAHEFVIPRSRGICFCLPRMNPPALAKTRSERGTRRDYG